MPLNRHSIDRRRVCQSEHKIQSGKGSLLIEMDQVPKILKPLVSEWVPAGFVVSFKVRVVVRRFVDNGLLTCRANQLETDPTLLIPKARQALERYGHQVVIGNDLHHRKQRVVLVSPKFAPSGGKPGPNGVEYDEKWIEIDTSPSSPHKEIEEEIVKELVAWHDDWIKRA